MTAVGETSDLHEFQSPVFPRDLQAVGPAAHGIFRCRSRAALENGARPFRRLDRIPPRAIQESGERDSATLESLHHALVKLLRRILQRVDHLSGRLISLASRAQA